jgi:hypothetical protein
MPGHPLARDLQNAFLFSDGGGSVAQDAMRGQAAALTYGYGTPAWVPEGLKFDGTASAGHVSQQVSADPGLAQSTSNIPAMTLLAAIRITATSKGGIIGIENGDIATNNSSNVRGVWLGIGNTSLDNVGQNLIALNENVAFQLPGSSIVVPLNVWTQIALVFLGFGATATFYVNGVNKGTTNFGGAAVNSSSPIRLMIGGYWVANGAAAREFTGTIRYAYHWSRALTPAEMQWLSAEPYALFAPPPAPTSFAPTTFVVTAAASISLTGSATVAAVPTAAASLTLTAACTSAAQPSATADVELAASATGAARPTAAADVELTSSATDRPTVTAAGDLELAAASTASGLVTAAADVELAGSATVETVATAAGALALAGAASPTAPASASGAVLLSASCSASTQPTAGADVELAASSSPVARPSAAGDLDLSASGVPFAAAGAAATLSLLAAGTPFAPSTAAGTLTLLARCTVEPPPGVQRVAVWSFGQAAGRTWRFGSAGTLWVFGEAIPRSSLPAESQRLLVP